MKLQNDKMTLQKDKKERERERRGATKHVKKLTKRAGKSEATQGENTEISAIKALKIRKIPPTEYSNEICYEYTNLEYTTEYTKHIKDTY